MEAVEQAVRAAARDGDRPAHPYYPPGLAVPHYAPNTTPVPVLLASFGLALAGFLAAAVALARRVRPAFRDAPASDQALFVWFALCGGLHCYFEAYFVLHHATLAGAQTLLAQLWKEYALSDARYVASDPFMLCIESLSAGMLGPACAAAAVAIVREAGGGAGGRPAASGLRHVLQLLVSFAHLYGVLLYYGTLAFAVALRGPGASHCRPEFVYVWVYFVGMNAPWLVVPVYALHNSIRQVRRAFAALAVTDTAAAQKKAL